MWVKVAHLLPYLHFSAHLDCKDGQNGEHKLQLVGMRGAGGVVIWRLLLDRRVETSCVHSFSDPIVTSEVGYSAEHWKSFDHEIQKHSRATSDADGSCFRGWLRDGLRVRL